MPRLQRTAEGALPLTPTVFHILLALVDRERHGYAIIREVEERTGGEIRLSTGTLYSAIKRILGAGLIEETETRPDPKYDDERRRYYRLTAYGRSVAQAEARRMDGLLGIARAKHLLSDIPRASNQH